MALFSRKKKNEESTVSSEAVTATTKPGLSTDYDLSSVLIKPRISEKAYANVDQGVYVFEVRPNATKRLVRDAVAALYNVTPVKVNIVNKKSSNRRNGRTGRTQHQPGCKKAYVYLKQGDQITLV